MITMDPFDPVLVSAINLLVLAACTSKYDADNPSWEMAMYVPFQDDFWGTMETKLDTLENKVKS